jgi:hypothetical protein
MISVSLRTTLWLITIVAVLPYILFDLVTSISDYALLDSRLHALVGLFAVIFSAIAYKAFGSIIEDEHFFSVVKMPDSGLPLDSYGQLFFRIKNIGFYYYQGKVAHQFKVSSHVSRVFIFLIFLGLGFNTFNQREINVLSNFAQYQSKDRYCQIEDKKKAATEVRPECRLIIRAYELGYAKDLGSCGADLEEAPKPCDMRYEDEPFFHYAYRRAVGTFDQLKRLSSESSPAKMQALVDRDVKRFKPMVNEMLAGLNNDPRSLHIVITNLPTPDIGISKRIASKLTPSSCINEYRLLPNKAEHISSRSKLGNTFHFVSGHLLFDSAYETTVANCIEYDYRWEVLPEICQAITSNPVEALKQQGYIAKIDQLIDRLDRRKITKPLSTAPQIKEISSIQCLSFGEFQTQMDVKSFKYRNHDFSFVWKRVSIPSLTSETPLRIFRESAHAFNPSFRYSQLSSRQSVNLSQEKSVTEELFNDSGFLLTRLGFLRDADIFIGSEWLLQRSDLLDLYPYYLHLNHFIESFRTRYKENYQRM